MKHILYAGLIICIFSAGSFAQTQDKVKSEIQQPDQLDEIGGPQMIFETLVVNYGDIDKGSDPLRVFRFTNTGIEPLVIKHAKGSCGCTVPEYPKAPIMPGETGEIKVRYDTNRMGSFTKTISLSTNINEENIVLTIKGNVHEKIEEGSVPAKENSIF